MTDDATTSADNGNTPFEVAVNNMKEAMAVVLVNEFHCDTKGGTPYIHTACERGWVNLVRALVQKHGIGILTDDATTSADNGNTPFEVAVNNMKEEMAVVLVNELLCDTKGGTPYIHTACERGWVNLVRALVQEHSTSIVTARDGEGNTSLHIAVISGNEDVILTLINEFDSDVSIKGYKGRSPLHFACAGRRTGLVRTLIHVGKADVTAIDDEDNTPLHVAAMSGCEDVVLVLINEFGCDINVTGHLGRSLLHSACASNNGSLVRLVSQYISSWVVDDNGDTPLHICASLKATRGVPWLCWNSTLQS